ncbi:hypothetical protein [Actinomadura sp. HBU206391]|uniref:hypothetical protein n=1 Tax=Actinomadura sp. HBU206391 TaxID=2731692 RepID=UPI00164FBED7|nr:hypothetical protein [Actinomadura sp. HBU206391]MBC6457289.1 hypothetical protein [Actinomadura sp. HBU206391]
MSDQDRERLGDAVRDAAAEAAGEVIGHWIARAHPDLPVLRWRAIHLDGRWVGLGHVTDVDQAVAEIRAVEEIRTADQIRQIVGRYAQALSTEPREIVRYEQGVVEVRTTTTLDGVEIQVFGYVKRGR